jgi:hypothetical protein
MNRMRIIALLAVLLIAGCAVEPRRDAGQPTKPSGWVRTAERAVEVIKSHIRKRGGDPAREEITAKWRRGEWHVTSWHIFYRANNGVSRFVPGGFTCYTVSPDGRITSTMPGR